MAASALEMTGLDLDRRVARLRMTCWQGRMDELASRLDEVAAEALASADARHRLWVDALRARLILHGADPMGAVDLVRVAHDGFHVATDGSERAIGLAFLGELYAQAGHAGLATDLTIIAAELIDHAESDPALAPDLLEACCWLSRALATLGLFEPAADFADRGLELSTAAGDRSWPGLSHYSAFMHLLRAEELNRAGETVTALEHVVAAEDRLGSAPASGTKRARAMDQAMTMLLTGWIAVIRDQAFDAGRILRRTRPLGRAADMGWLEAAATYLCGRNAWAGGDLDAAAALLAEAATGLGRWSWLRMHEWCLLDLIDLETDRGDERAALRWLDSFLRRRGEIQHRRQELASDLFQRQVAVLNESRQRSTLARHAVEDPLTGLANRRRAEERLASFLGDAGQHPLCLAVVDVDEFKTVNDAAGHTMGDAVLVRVAELISDNARTQDLVARWAGDEFVVAMPAATEEQAFVAMERLRRDVAGCDWGRLGLHRAITVSIGISGVLNGGTSGTVHDLFHAADTALFAAKRAGRNLVLNAGQALIESGGILRRASR